MATPVTVSDLKLADVLLYHGTGFISKLIRLFDGSEYSHASIYYDNSVLEAIAEGVKKTPVDSHILDSNSYVDVYRFISSDGKGKLGDGNYPSQPILDRINFYEKEGDRYAYEQLIMLALLSTTRRISVPVIGWLIREILDTAFSVLNKIIAMGKEPMICSELVYRCYSEALPAGNYDLTIRGADVPLTANFLPLVSTFPKVSSEINIIEQNETKALTQQMEDFLAVYALSKHKTGAKIENLSLASTASLFAVPDFVSPKDLKQTPNLFKIGTLQI